METVFEQESKTLGDYLIILKRHRTQGLIAAVIVLLASVLIALALPANYRSTATILIEEQQIPRDLVRSTISNYADQQIHMLTQRVMTLNNIQKIVQKYGLYHQDETTSPMPATQLAKRFTKNVTLELVSADVINPRSGRPSKATIAFTLSVDDQNPETAQQVADELVTLYLNENKRIRAARVSGAAQFLAAEAEVLSAQLKQRELEISEFKQVSEGALPELYQFNLSVVDRTERELADVNLRIQELKKRKIQLSAELAQLSPFAPVVLANGEVVLSDTDRLRVLTSEYRKKTALYHDGHPDIRRLQREIKSLKTALGAADSEHDIVQQLQAQRDEVEALRQRYTADHPRVLNAEIVVKQLESMRGQIKPSTGAKVVADNPSYILLDTQLKATSVEIQSLNTKKTQLQKKLNHYEALIKRAPSVEKDYQALLRDYQASQLKFQEIKAKLREAEIAKKLEQERKGDRFVLIEPPVFPLTSSGPNRSFILLMGFLLAMVTAVVYVLALESMDHSIRGSRALSNVTGEPPFVVVPYLHNMANANVLPKQGTLTAAVVVTAIMTASLLTANHHTLWTPTVDKQAWLRAIV